MAVAYCLRTVSCQGVVTVVYTISIMTVTRLCHGAADFRHVPFLNESGPSTRLSDSSGNSSKRSAEINRPALLIKVIVERADSAEADSLTLVTSLFIDSFLVVLCQSHLRGGC